MYLYLVLSNTANYNTNYIYIYALTNNSTALENHMQSPTSLKNNSQNFMCDIQIEYYY